MRSREIYLLPSKRYSPETIAVTFAKTSRSPESFEQIAQELSDEKSAQFHEKWVVGYGHASVAEHAVLHIAFENVSRLAVETIESNRLASYTEKSTRYQKWGLNDFYIPKELDEHPELKQEYIETCQMLFETYAEALKYTRLAAEKEYPRKPDESEDAYDRRIRSKYADACRYLLPASALTNVGMTANARVLEHAIRKMLSHPLDEVREIGRYVKSVARQEVPTLVKYAEADTYLLETSKSLKEHAIYGDIEIWPEGWCKLVHYDEDGEMRVLAAALYRFSNVTYPVALQAVRSMTSAERQKLAESLLGRLGEHDTPLRELEYCTYTFDLVMDNGAYAEFKRHRMMTQTAQPLTTRLGYVTPYLISKALMKPKYDEAMDKAAETFEKLRAFNPDVAQYVVPNGYYRRVLAQFNLREAYHFIRLRSSKNAHISMQRLAARMYDEMQKVHPLLTQYMRLPEVHWQEIEREWLGEAGGEI